VPIPRHRSDIRDLPGQGNTPDFAKEFGAIDSRKINMNKIRGMNYFNHPLMT
jgi:hypothetical protein